MINNNHACEARLYAVGLVSVHAVTALDMASATSARRALLGWRGRESALSKTGWSLDLGNCCHPSEPSVGDLVV
jgi:hypothetical protein